MAKSSKRRNRSKYNNKKVELDGRTFDSKAEVSYYLHLKEMEQAGSVTSFECQVPFTLQDGYRSPETGRKVRPITYVADYVVRYPDGRQEVVDVKGSRGTMTDVFKMKKKMFEYRYKVPLKIVIISNGKIE
jgi:hypothetical protein